MTFTGLTTKIISTLPSSTADKIAVFNTIGVWLAGIGTFMAVTVSLWLARRQGTIQLRVSAGHRLLIGGSFQKEYPDYCAIKVVNTGYRSATISSIGWRVGLFRKRYAIQVFDSSLSSPVPVTLRDGDEANFLVPFRIENDDYPPWIVRFPASFLENWPRILSHTLRVQVYTSVGKTFERRIESDLRKLMVESVLQEKASKTAR